MKQNVRAHAHRPEKQALLFPTLAAIHQDLADQKNCELPGFYSRPLHPGTTTSLGIDLLDDRLFITWIHTPAPETLWEWVERSWRRAECSLCKREWVIPNEATAVYCPVCKGSTYAGEPAVTVKAPVIPLPSTLVKQPYPFWSSPQGALVRLSLYALLWEVIMWWIGP